MVVSGSDDNFERSVFRNVVICSSDPPIDSGKIGTSNPLMAWSFCGGCSSTGSLLVCWRNPAVIMTDCEVKGAIVVIKCVERAPTRMRTASRRESARMRGGMRPDADSDEARRGRKFKSTHGRGNDRRLKFQQ